VERIPQGAPFNLDGAVRGEAAGVHGTLQNVTATTYQHFPARGARITALSNGSPATVFERTILANGEAFDLQYVEAGSDVKTPPASYTTFLGVAEDHLTAPVVSASGAAQTQLA